MEQFTFNYALSGKPITGKRSVCGVVGSGNLEVIIEENSLTEFEITTSVDHYQHIWKLVIDDFISQYQPIGLKFSINDNGATPATVSLRLRQAFELFQGYQKIGSNYLELDARKRILSLLDKNSFKEWLADETFYSPHLAALGLPGEADDGVVIGSGKCWGKEILIAAQQKDFMGGAVGEIHGAKLTGLFKNAVKLKVSAVILLIDSGGVRLQEANAGEIAISEIIRAIFAARQNGIITVGIICGKNGAYGGMGIISTCCDYIIVDETSRIGVSGAEVIQTVKGVEAFDAQDRALVWRVYGGKTRYLQRIADAYVDSSIENISDNLKIILNNKPTSLLERAKKDHALLKKRFEETAGHQEEGTYLAQLNPEIAKTIFDMNKDSFLAAVTKLGTRNGE
jgi:malonate decarboxylase beta subunit